MEPVTMHSERLTPFEGTVGVVAIVAGFVAGAILGGFGAGVLLGFAAVLAHFAWLGYRRGT